MAKFNDEHKEEMGSNNYFEQGVHKVKITGVEFGETEDGKEWAEFSVTDDSGEKEGNARVWFTTDKAIWYSFNVFRSIFVHNAPKAQKDKMRKSIDDLKDTDELAKAAESLKGKECWYSVYENPERTYTDNSGKLRNSFDRNVYGYDPGPRKEAKTAEVDDSDMPDVDNDEPFADF